MGFFKTYLTSDDGRERVTGFQMAGDTNGLDGIGNDSYTCESVALEEGEVCVIPFIALDEISYKLPLFKHHAYKLLSREIVRYYGVMLMLGSLRAEERVAVFLFSLTLETVSRTLSKLMDLGILIVKLRRIKILNLEALKNMTNFGHAT
jgi:CRP/FNR family transcriptional regulator